MGMYNEIKNKQFDFGKYGGFFAFGEEQFKRQTAKDEKDTKYVHLGMGLYVKKEEKDKLLKELDNFTENKRKEIKELCSFKETFDYEWDNHETSFTGDPENAILTTLIYFDLEDMREYVKERNTKKSRSIRTFFGNVIDFDSKEKIPEIQKEEIEKALYKK
jgi:hypothetical protein